MGKVAQRRNIESKIISTYVYIHEIISIKLVDKKKKIIVA